MYAKILSDGLILLAGLMTSQSLLSRVRFRLTSPETGGRIRLSDRLSHKVPTRHAGDGKSSGMRTKQCRLCYSPDTTGTEWSQGTAIYTSMQGVLWKNSNFPASLCQ